MKRRPGIIMGPGAGSLGAELVATSSFTATGSTMAFSLPPGAEEGDFVVVNVLRDENGAINVATSAPGYPWAPWWPISGSQVYNGATNTYYRMLGRFVVAADVTGGACHSLSNLVSGAPIVVEVWRGVEGLLCPPETQYGGLSTYAVPSGPPSSFAFGALGNPLGLKLGTAKGVREWCAAEPAGSPVKPALLNGPTPINNAGATGTTPDLIVGSRLEGLSAVAGQTPTWTGLPTAGGSLSYAVGRLIFGAKPCVRSTIMPQNGGTSLAGWVVIGQFNSNLMAFPGDFLLVIGAGPGQIFTQNRTAAINSSGNMGLIIGMPIVFYQKTLVAADIEFTNAYLEGNKNGSFWQLTALVLNGVSAATLKGVSASAPVGGSTTPARVTSVSTSAFTPAANAVGHLLVLQVETGGSGNVLAPPTVAGWTLMRYFDNPSDSQYRTFIWAKIGQNDRHDGSAVTISSLVPSPGSNVGIYTCAILELT